MVVAALAVWSAGDAQSANISISPTTLPDWTLNVAYSQKLTASGCTPVCLWSSSGKLPTGLSLDPVSGAITGTPGATGTFGFTATASDVSQQSGSQSYTITINAIPLITTTSLPGGQIGTVYSQAVSVANGTPPFTFSVSAGGLPTGLSLNPSTGVISGTPRAAGSSNFTVMAADAAKASASQDYIIKISGSSPLTITTTSLAGGTLGIADSQGVAATGGTRPSTWSTTSGSLPNGLTVPAQSGAIRRTPTSTGAFAFTVRVTDQNSTTARMPLSITVAANPQAPTMSLNGVPTNATSAQQISFSLTLSSGYPAPITGHVTLSFQPNAAVAVDDPAIQFSGGGRTASFTIPANSTSATFNINPVAFQTGTVAGTITLTVSSDLPGGSVSRTVTVARAAPVIQSAKVTTIASGFQIQVAGFSNTRELANASFHFTAVTGQTVQTADLTVNLSSVASQWYSSTGSNPFGGQFLLVMPFTIQQGAANGLASVAVQVQNGQNTSAAATANF